MNNPAIKLRKLLARPVPIFVIQIVLSKCINTIAKNNPRIFTRLGIYSQKCFLIAPTDMPFSLFLRANPQRPELLVRRTDSEHWDAKISGTFMNLLKLVEARIDGDALFFSRQLVIEGDTEAVVALRNALDDMDSTIIDEAAKAFGKPGTLGLKFARKLEDFHHAFAK